MEAVASVASVTALIAFSIQSTKAVYQTIDNIRDGPSIITSLLKSTGRLEDILQQLHQVLSHHYQSQQAPDPILWEPLNLKISQCSKDIQEANAKLGVLNPNHAKHHVDRAWKRVKLSLKEKFFTRLDGQIKGHLAELTIQLQMMVFHCDTSRDARQTEQHHRSEISIRAIHNEMGQQSTSIQNHVTVKAQDITTSLMTLENGISTADKSHTEKSRQLRESLEQITNTVTNHLYQNEESSRQHMQSSSKQIASRLDEVQAMSTDQSRVIIELLQQIHGCLKNESSAASASDGPSTRSRDTLNDVTFEDEGTILAAMDRLCRFASQNTTIYHADEAEEIIDDLKQIIDVLLDHDGKSPDAAGPGRKRKRLDDSEEPNVSYEIKKIRGIVTASRAIEVGGSKSNRPIGSNHARQKRMRQSTKIFDMSDCTAVVSVKRGSYSPSTRMSDNEMGSVLSALDYLHGNISLLPTHSTKPIKISASFIQQLTCSGFNSPHPRISYHPIVPKDAKIIQAVRSGDVGWMVELFNSGEASLHDCDVEGRSLLNYAIYDNKIDSCRFLVNHGADVDSMEKIIGLDGSIYVVPLGQQCTNYFEIDQTSLDSNLAIDQCLLEAGADTLLEKFNEEAADSVFNETLLTGPAASLALILKYDKYSIDLNRKDTYGQTSLLLMLLKFIPAPATSDKVGNDLSRNILILLAHGADLGTRDYDGCGCLHAITSNRFFTQPRPLTLRGSVLEMMMIDAIALLITKGADKYAVDNEGYSVTEWAHLFGAGYAWERALEKAGLDVEQVYQNDHGNGWKVSDDILAPTRYRPRLRIDIQKTIDIYNCVICGKCGWRPNANRITEIESQQDESTTEDPNMQSAGEQEDREGYDDDSNHDQDYQDDDQDGRSEQSSKSDSDEEMGGVPVINTNDHYNGYQRPYED